MEMKQFVGDRRGLDEEVVGLVAHALAHPRRVDHRINQEKGDVATVSRMAPGVHTGTHMDAPLHFVRNSPTIEQMPIDATVGPARVIRIWEGTAIHRAELLQHSIQPGERILFRTANTDAGPVSTTPVQPVPPLRLQLYWTNGPVAVAWAPMVALHRSFMGVP